MRKILMAGAALALIGATAAHADDRDKEVLGGAAGGAAGAAAGLRALRSARKPPFPTTPASTSWKTRRRP